MFSLLLKKEFLLYFLVPSTFVSVIGGLIGIYISLQNEVVVSSTESNSNVFLPILPGYIFCALFTFLAIRIFYENPRPYVIGRPRTFLLSQGITYFIAYSVAQLVTTRLLVNPNSLDPRTGYFLDTAVYYTGNQFMAWIFGGFLLIYFILVQKVDYRTYRINQYSYRYPQPMKHPQYDNTRICVRCGKTIPEKAKFCTECAYPVGIPKEKDLSFNRVSFKQALDLLDSEAYNRGTRMDIEFECIIQEPVSSEKTGGPAPYRTIRVSDPSRLNSRTLYVWGDPGHRYNINLVSSLSIGDRILVIGPRRPKDSSYYKDHTGNDVFWIERWDGTVSDTGTRLLKLEDVSPYQSKEITFAPEIKVSEKMVKKAISPQMDLPPFFCQLCSIKHSAGTPRMQCDACGRFVCVDSFADMVKVARSSCPMCDGKLSAV